jgi:hypothetical protein
MIYKPDNDKPNSKPFLAQLRGIAAHNDWLKTIGDDIHQRTYVDSLDWTSEHLPESIIPFLPAETMTTDEAAEFFSEFTTKGREALTQLIEAKKEEMIARRMRHYREDRETAVANLAPYLEQLGG